MRRSEKNLQEYYMTCKDYFIELGKKNFSCWFLSYHSTLKTRNGLALDVGCGVGQVVNKLAQEGLCAVGIDVSRIGIQMASKKGKGVFIVASAINLPFRDNSFTSVGFYDFLEHTYNPEICLSEMVRVLKLGGKIVAFSPNFLRVIGLSRPYHWHMKGLKQKIFNLYTLWQKAITSKIFPEKMRFEFMQPLLDPKGQGGDADAVCVINPIDLKFHLMKLGVKVVKESAVPNQTRRITKKIGELPIIRSTSSFYLLVGIKISSQNV